MAILEETNIRKALKVLQGIPAVVAAMFHYSLLLREGQTYRGGTSCIRKRAKPTHVIHLEPYSLQNK